MTDQNPNPHAARIKAMGLNNRDFAAAARKRCAQSIENTAIGAWLQDALIRLDAAQLVLEIGVEQDQAARNSHGQLPYEEAEQ